MQNFFEFGKPIKVSSEPERAALIPKNAIWKEELNEWELSQKNKQGNYIGVAKWWLAPKGYLVGECHYIGEKGNHFEFARFHHDGSWSKKGTYLNDLEIGISYFQRCETETIEYFALPNDSRFTHVWFAELTYKDGKMIAQKYFDKDKNELDITYYIIK